MKIYISHSRSFDFKKELYEQIRSSELNEQHEFILPHEESDGTYPVKQLLYSGECNLVIAEVSYPSTGQGIELGWADALGITVVCMYKDGAKVSPSVSSVTNKMMMYTDKQNMIEDIKGLLQTYET